MIGSNEPCKQNNMPRTQPPPHMISQSATSHRCASSSTPRSCQNGTRSSGRCWSFSWGSATEVLVLLECEQSKDSFIDSSIRS
jgi:hypothetical protein